MPIVSTFSKNINDAYNSIAHLGNALWWRARLCYSEVNWRKIKTLLFLDIPKLFHSNIILRKQARSEIIDITSGLLGYIGIFSTAIFTPLRTLFKFQEKENKLINCLTSIGATTQHIFYFFKFTLDELFKIQNKQKGSSYSLFSLGLTANTFNILLPIVDVLPISNRVKNLWYETSQGLGLGFFSFRRNINGKNWLEKL